MRLSAVGTVVLTAVLTLSACSGSDSPASLPGGGASGSGGGGTTTAPSSAAPSVPPTSIDFRPPGKLLDFEKTLLAVYRQFWEAVATAFATGDPAAIKRVTTQPATGLFVNRVGQLKSAGQTERGPISLTPVVRNRSGSAATVIDCADLRQFRTYDGDGRALRPPDTAYTIIQVDLVNRGGRWVVDRYLEKLGGCKRPGG